MRRPSAASTSAHDAVTRRVRAPLRWGLALDLTVVLVLGLGLGSLEANLGRLAVPIPPLVLDLAGAGVVGLLAGLAARLTLRGWTRTLRFLLSFLTLLLWVVLLEITYALWMGLGPVWYVSRADDWVEGGQLAIGCLAIIAASVAGRRAGERVLLRPRSAVNDARLPARASLTAGLSLSLSVAVSLGMWLAFLQANAGRLALPIPLLVVALAGAGVVGLLMGVTASLTLRGWSEALRLLVALLALLVWMAVVEVTYTLWQGPSSLRYVARGDDWVKMGQLAIGCMAAVVGGVARRRPVPGGVALEAEPAPGPAAPVRPARNRRPPEAAARANGRRPARATTARRRRGRGLPRLALPALRRRPARATNNSGVKVIAKAEDRCPYCLDVVEKRDSRGVVVCEICGTPHHADCWEAGGACQVPHLTT